MSENPKISIILTSYNHAKYLREAIDSALAQTFSNFELIIWDDASTDESWEIIGGYTDPRIRRFRNESNRGGGNIRRAFEQGVRGKYIAIHHSDDIWEPDKLEKQITFLDANPQIGAVFTWAKIIDEDGQPFLDQSHFYYKIFEQPNRTRYEWLNYFFFIGNALCHPSILIRKQCYNEIGLYRHGMAQIPDLDMWVRLCLKYDIHVLPEKLIQYRVRAGEMNVSGNRLDSNVRVQFEYFQMLNKYREINSAEEFLKIFPRSQKYIKSGDSDIDYTLGMISLETGTYRFTELFGLTILFEVLNDPEKAKKIYALYNFSHNDFIELTAKYDVFSIELITKLAAQVHTLSSQLQNVRAELENIHNSKAWKLTQFINRLRFSLAPPSSFRERILHSIFGYWNRLQKKKIS